MEEADGRWRKVLAERLSDKDREEQALDAARLEADRAMAEQQAAWRAEKDRLKAITAENYATAAEEARKDAKRIAEREAEEERDRAREREAKAEERGRGLGRSDAAMELAKPKPDLRMSESVSREDAARSVAFRTGRGSRQQWKQQKQRQRERRRM